MKRRSRDAVLMDAAWTFSTRSTCKRGEFGAVGAVIAVDGRIVSTGYNGAPSGLPHCDHTCTCTAKGKTGRTTIRLVNAPDQHDDGCPANAGCDITVHAEANAVAFAARYGTSTNNATLYTTVSPCLGCAKLIINAGLVRVVYHGEYRDTAGLDLLMRANVGVSQCQE